MNHRRNEYLKQLTASAPLVSRDWIEAAATFLAVGDNGHRFFDRVLGILHNDKMPDFCSEAEHLFAAYKHNRERLEHDQRNGSRGYEFNFGRYRESLIQLITFKGGLLASETLAQISARRRKLAPLARGLAKGLAAEIPASRLAPDEAAKSPAGGRASSAYVDLIEDLLTLAFKLDRDAPLWLLDPIELAGSALMPQRRESAQQLLLERRLCDEFRAWTGGPQHKLVATAVRVALDVDDIDADGVKEREKLYRASRTGQFQTRQRGKVPPTN